VLLYDVFAAACGFLLSFFVLSFDLLFGLVRSIPPLRFKDDAPASLSKDAQPDPHDASTSDDTGCTDSHLLVSVSSLFLAGLGGIVCGVCV
jgi:hypothetical protein